MKLARPQKKFLKKNLKKLSLGEIARKIDVHEKDLQEYLKSIWPKEKYQRFLSQQKRSIGSSEPLGFNNFEKKFLSKKWFKQNLPVLGLLTFLVFGIYLNSLSNDFVSDDINAIVQNKNIGNFILAAKEQPLSFLRYLSYFLAYKIGGLNPLFFRVINILFHLGSTWVIYALVGLLYNPFLALMVASIFAVHPILSEAVVWISGGVHSQYSFFLLFSFFLYLLHQLNRQKQKYYFTSIFSFFLALLTSEKAAILPLIIVVYEFSFGHLSKTWKKTIPYFFLSVVWTTAVFSAGFLNKRLADLASSHYQTEGFYNPFIQIPTAIYSYLRLIFWPDKLTLYHSEMVFSQFQYIFTLTTTLFFFSIIPYTLINKKYRQYFFWLTFFVISLLPMLTPFKVAWVVAERYVYLGSLGIFVLIALGISKIGEIAKDKQVSYIILAVILVLLSARTIIRNNDWKNQDTLWLATAKTSPSSPQNHNNLGDYYGRQGDFQRSIEEFKKAIELNPGYADAYHNLANTYAQIGQTEEAIANYQKAIEFGPHLWQSHQALAAVYFNQEKYDLAKQEIEEAIRINPQNSNLYLNLGIIYLKLGDTPNAQNTLNTALQLDPNDRKAKELLLYESTP